MSVYGTYGVRCFGFELSFTLVPYGRYSLEIWSVADKAFVGLQEFRTKRAAIREMERFARVVGDSLPVGAECLCRVVDSSGEEVDTFWAAPRLVRKLSSSR